MDSRLPFPALVRIELMACLLKSDGLLLKVMKLIRVLMVSHFLENSGVRVEIEAISLITSDSEDPTTEDPAEEVKFLALVEGEISATRKKYFSSKIYIYIK